MKSKMGRPPVPKSKLRAIILNVRLSPEESRVISAAVKRAGESASEWVRKTLFSAAQQDRQDG
jgi:predicted HicB family RNase H-like nuclease